MANNIEFKIRDRIIAPDGSQGVIIKVLKTRYHVIWLDNYSKELGPFVINDKSDLRFCKKISRCNYRKFELIKALYGRD